MSSAISTNKIEGLLRVQFPLDFDEWVCALHPGDYYKGRHKAAEIIGVHIDTVANWISGKSFPGAADILTFYYIIGKIITISKTHGLVIIPENSTLDFVGRK